MSNADPAERKPGAAADELEETQEEAASAGAPAKKSAESSLAAANAAIAEGRWEAAVASLRVAIEQSRDPVERDRLLDSLCGVLERLGRECDPLERQYAASPWAMRRASERASRQAKPPTESPASVSH